MFFIFSSKTQFLVCLSFCYSRSSHEVMLHAFLQLTVEEGIMGFSRHSIPSIRNLESAFQMPAEVRHKLCLALDSVVEVLGCQGPTPRIQAIA